MEANASQVQKAGADRGPGEGQLGLQGAAMRILVRSVFMEPKKRALEVKPNRSVVQELILFTLEVYFYLIYTRT